MDTGAACYKKNYPMGQQQQVGQKYWREKCWNTGIQKVVYAGMERASVRTDELYLSIFTGRADEIEIYSLRTEKRIYAGEQMREMQEDGGEELYQEPEIVPLVPGFMQNQKKV